MKTFFGWLLAALALFLVIATIIPLVEIDAWWIRAVGFPRLQILLFALLTAAALAVFYRRSIAGRVAACAMVACVILQAVTIFPYSPFAHVESLPATRIAPHRSLSIMVANVRMRNRNIDAFARQVRASTPDVILVIEADEWWAGKLRFLEKLYPHSVYEPRANTFGMLVISRRPLHDVKVRYIDEDSIPSVRATVELPSREMIDLYAVHPKPPHIGGADGGSAMDDEPELIAVAREVSARNRPAVVAGDFNDVAWSRTTREFQSISATRDPRVGRGMYNTFHAEIYPLRYSLDHVFHTAELRLIEIRRLESIGSDHFPLFVSLSYEPTDTTSRAPR